MQGWLQSNSSLLTSLSWHDFVNKFRSHLFDPNWDCSICSELLAMKMCPSTTFLAFVHNFELQNTLLVRTPMHFSDKS